VFGRWEINTKRWLITLNYQWKKLLKLKVPQKINQSTFDELEEFIFYITKIYKTKYMATIIETPKD